MSSETYRVPTTPVEVKLTLCDGRSEETVFFLATSSQMHHGPESLEEFLNEDRAFIAARSLSSDRHILVNRQAIVVVEAAAEVLRPGRIEDAVASSIDLLRVETSAGLVVEGTLLLVAPPTHARISDFFNLNDAFLPLEIGERVLFVNKHHVIAVRL